MKSDQLLFVERCHDVAYLDGIMRAPEVWPLVSDDANGKPEDVSLAIPISDPRHFFLKAQVNARPAGFIAFLDTGSDCYEMHTNLLLHARGAKALELGWLAVRWLFEQTAAMCIRTYVFSTAAAARLMMRWARWRELRREAHPNTVKGRAVERIWYEFTRVEWQAMHNRSAA